MAEPVIFRIPEPEGEVPGRDSDAGGVTRKEVQALFYMGSNPLSFQ